MTTITIPRETFDAMREALKWTLARVERLAPHQAIEGDAALYEIAAAMAALSAAKAVSEDKRQSVTITSVKMVGGVAPEAELMRQATEQLEGMGFRVEHPKAVQPQAQGATVNLTDAQIDKAALVETGFEGDGTQAMNSCDIRRIVRAALAAHPQASEPQAQGEDKLRETVATVLEGWTIPDGVRKMLETAYWSHPQASEPAGCTWTQQDDEHMPGTWASSCGELWSFIDGGPKENRVSYCHHCGGKVNLAAPEATK